MCLVHKEIAKSAICQNIACNMKRHIYKGKLLWLQFAELIKSRSLKEAVNILPTTLHLCTTIIRSYVKSQYLWLLPLRYHKIDVR